MSLSSHHSFALFVIEFSSLHSFSYLWVLIFLMSSCSLYMFFRVVSFLHGFLSFLLLHFLISPQFLIFFIDYGDFEWAPRSRILPLPIELQKLTPSVIWCTLKGVQPLDPARSANVEGTVILLWSRDVVDAFKLMVTEKKVFSAVLTEEALQQINK